MLTSCLLQLRDLYISRVKCHVPHVLVDIPDAIADGCDIQQQTDEFGDSWRGDGLYDDTSK